MPTASRQLPRPPINFWTKILTKAQVLGLRLRPGDVVVLANLSVHKVDGLEQVIQKYGARLRYLPPYSPDFNPIELAFSKRKTWLRKAQARTRDALEEAIRTAAEWIRSCLS